MESRTSGGAIRLIVLALFAVAIFIADATFDGLPSPKGREVPATEFSAARAYDTLGRLLGPEVPHPVSSAANAAVRDRVRAEFARLGIKTNVYRARACNGRPLYGFFVCGTTEDVIADIAPGAGKAIVLVAHYDSVPAGPGASDDQSGVATILETVRALKARGLHSRHPITAVITDGEEAGLLGAAAYLDNPAFRDRVGVAVNVEARGNQGPSFLFQTSPGDGRLIDLYARSVPEFATSSLFAVIYKLLPNDTDLTIFLNHDLTGYNFAFTGNVADYHTTQDLRANLSWATLQHHGDNLLGITTALMQTDFASLKGGDDIYLTMFGHLLPRLPASWAVPLALLEIALLIAAAFLADGEVLGIGRRLAAAAMPLAGIAGAAAAGWLLHTVAALVSGQPDPSYAHPVWLRTALGFGVALALVGVSRFAGPRLTALSVWGWIAGLGLLAAVVLPGISPYFLFPGLIGAVLIFAQSFSSSAWKGAAAQLALLVAAIGALVVWLSLAAAGEMVQGLALHPIFTVPAALGGLTLLPLLAARPLARASFWRALGACAVVALGLAVTAGLQPAFSAASPQRLNVDFVDDHVAHKAVWAVETGAKLPQAFRAAAPFSAKPVPVVPLLRQSAYVTPAGATRFAMPAVTVSSKAEGAGRVVTLAIAASQNANRVVAVIPKDAALVRATLDGKSFVPDPKSLNPVGTILACTTDDCRRMTVTLAFADKKPITVTIGEQHYGVPPDGARLVAARPATAVASQSGDTTVVFGTLKL